MKIPQILVVYDSRTGNTAKMAALVAEGARSAPDTEVRSPYTAKLLKDFTGGSSY